MVKNLLLSSGVNSMLESDRKIGIHQVIRASPPDPSSTHGCWLPCGQSADDPFLKLQSCRGGLRLGCLVGGPWVVVWGCQLLVRL